MGQWGTLTTVTASKCKTDPTAVRAFRITRGAAGLVEVLWKPKAESGDWRGQNGQFGTPDFIVLKGRPRGMPPVIEPRTHVMQKKYYKQLLGTKMTECLKAEGALSAKKWLAKAAEHGVVPIHRRIQEPGEISAGALGAEVELKCGHVTAVVQNIEDRDQTAKEFWALPEDLQQILAANRATSEAASDKHRQHPAIGYKKVPMRQRPTWEGSAAQAYAAEKKMEQVHTHTYINLHI